MNRPFTTIALLAGLSLSSAAQATLVDRGGGLIYDTDLNVTWLKNAKAAFGSTYDSADGSTDGAMTWQNAMDWAANLSYYDSIRDVTYSDWRLPTTIDTGAPGCDYANGGTDCGYNINTATSDNNTAQLSSNRKSKKTAAIIRSLIIILKRTM